MQAKTSVAAAKQSQFVPIFSISARHQVAPVAAIKSVDAVFKVNNRIYVATKGARDEDKNRHRLLTTQASKSTFNTSDKIVGRKSVIAAAAPLAAGSGNIHSSRSLAAASLTS